MKNRCYSQRERLKTTLIFYAVEPSSRVRILKALGLVDILVAHYEKKYQDEVFYGANSTNLPVVAPGDTQAVIVNGDKIQIVGSGERPVFNGFERILGH